MTPQKRALLYIRRKKKFSILLFLLLALLFSACLIGIIMVRALQDTQATLRRTFAGSFYVSTNWPLVGTQPENVPGFKFLDDEMAEQIGNFEGITAINATSYDYLASDELTLIPGAHARYLKETDPDDESYKNKLYFTKAPSYSFNSYSELAPEFRMGQYTLVKGRHITPEDSWSAVISRALAEQNGLSVGDRFEAGYSPETRAEDPSLPEEPFSFTIVGIFDITGQQTQLNQAEPSMLQNAVFIDAAAGHAIDSGDPTHSRYRYGVIFMVDDPRDLEQTVAAAQSNLDMQHFRCVVDDTEYRQSVQPLERMETTMKLLTVVLVGIGTIILALVLLLWIRQRTKEIGIYLSIGLSKRNILLQLLTESVVSSVIGGSIAIPLTFAITAAVRFSGSAAQMLPAPPTVSIIVTWIAVLAVSILATLLAAIRLLQLHPKDILSTL